MQIEVTQKHIDKGERFAPCKCPIALAVIETLGRDQVYIGSQEVRINNLEKTVEIELPEAAREFIYRFDALKDVQPFTFDFPVEEALCDND
jgi:hypothetical protein